MLCPGETRRVYHKTDHPESETSLFMLRSLFSRENLLALLLCFILIALVVVTADKSPQWIYQGF